MFGGGDRQESHDSEIHASTTESTYGTSNDESVHGRSSAANGRSNLEKEDGDEVKVLGIELRIDLAPEIVGQMLRLLSIFAAGIAYHTRFVEAAATKKAMESQGSLSMELKRSTMAG